MFGVNYVQAFSFCHIFDIFGSMNQSHNVGVGKHSFSLSIYITSFFKLDFLIWCLQNATFPDAASHFWIYTAMAYFAYVDKLFDVFDTITEKEYRMLWIIKKWKWKWSHLEHLSICLRLSIFYFWAATSLGPHYGRCNSKCPNHTPSITILLSSNSYFITLQPVIQLRHGQNRDTQTQEQAHSSHSSHHYKCTDIARASLSSSQQHIYYIICVSKGKTLT